MNALIMQVEIENNTGHEESEDNTSKELKFYEADPASILAIAEYKYRSITANFYFVDHYPLNKRYSAIVAPPPESV